MPLRFGMQHPTWIEMIKNRRLEIPEPEAEPKYDAIDSTGYRYGKHIIPNDYYWDFDDKLRDLPRRTRYWDWSPIDDAIENEMSSFDSVPRPYVSTGDSENFGQFLDEALKKRAPQVKSK